LPGNARPVRCTRVSDGQPQGYILENGILRMTVPVVETMEMVRIDF
jgi:hypothetical protein